MRRLPVRLPVRLEKLLGLWRLRRLLLVLGHLSLVLDQITLSRHRLTQVTGPGLARPGPLVLFAAPRMLAIRQYHGRVAPRRASTVTHARPADHDLRIGLRW